MTPQPSSKRCQVRSCAEPGEEVWDLPGAGPLRQALLCPFHRQALDAGEPFALDGMDIVVGSDLPPELYSFVAHHGNSGDYFELVFGRDGVEEHRLKARVSKAVLQKMLDWA